MIYKEVHGFFISELYEEFSKLFLLTPWFILIYTTSRDDLFTFLFSCLTSFHDYELAVAFSVKTLSVKSNEFFVKWRNECLMLTKSITDEKILPTKNFTIYQIFWNLLRAFFFTQVAQKYRPSSVRLNIWHIR